jgi:quercetin dioxygenase-like cupin family protein
MDSTAPEPRPSEAMPPAASASPPVALRWADVPLAPGLRPGASRQAVAGQRLSVVRARIETDATFDGTLHAHEHEQMLLMVSGRLELQIEEARAWLSPGEFAYFPSGTYHGAVGVGDEGAEYFEIFSPPRIDQLIGYIGPSALTFPRVS